MNTKTTNKSLFNIPEDLVYLDGNSLGMLPKGAAEAAARTIQSEWGELLIRAWNKADWIGLPMKVGDRIAALIGAPAGSVATGDTLSIKVYQALAAALKMRPGRKVILSDKGNFPSDLYMAQGLLKTLDRDYRLETPEPEDVFDHIDEDVAVVMLTHVDYRTGRLHDMQAITQRAHEKGAVVIWDLAHSAGAMALDIAGSNCEFAVGCTYKYLNGGPGAPAFIYARPDLVTDVEPALAGWLGHAAPFEMSTDYSPAMSTERLRVGTPPIVQLAILDAALDVWEGVSLHDLRADTQALSTQFIEEVEAKCPELRLASPRDPNARGSQVSFAFEHSYETVQALIEHGVVGDFRAPDLMRFGFTPLYLDATDVTKGTDILERVIKERLWDQPRYQQRNRVT